MRALTFLNRRLSRRDWVYLLSLLVPLVIYNLALKADAAAARPGNELGLAQTLDMMRSDIFFNLGYMLLWIGLFTMLYKGPLRWLVVFLFHAITVLVVIVTTCARQYFLENGSTLDYGVITAPASDEVQRILTQRVSLSAWLILFGAVLYAIAGPWLLTNVVGWWRGWPRRSSPAGTTRPSSSYSRGPRLSSLGLLLLGLTLGLLSLTPSSDPVGGSKSFARDPFVNMVLTGVEEAVSEEYSPEADIAAVEQRVESTSLEPSSQAEKRNVVLIHLESTRAQSATPYNEDVDTMPFLGEIAKSSLVAERAYVGSVPRSTLSNISVNCGIEVPPRLGPEYEPGGVPARCLPTLLKEQGYRTVFFSSNMDSFGDIATKNFGYEKVFAPPDSSTPVEHWDQSMDTQRFVETSYFNYEDDVMLGPSERWLTENGDEPFVAQYLTGTGHDDYRCLGTSYGYEYFADNELVNSYLNCLRLQDIFLEQLFDQYKEQGLYENTIFVLFGDHGEGFGEHGRFLHGDTPYEEGLKVPLIVHAPGWFEDGQRVEGLSNFTDVMPTVLEMLGYEVKDGEYPGYSLLHPRPGGRTLMFSCISERKCLASIRGYEKYIHHYGDQPDEYFDLREDPFERYNLAGQLSQEEIDKRRDELLAWLARVDTEYGAQ